MPLSCLWKHDRNIIFSSGLPRLPLLLFASLLAAAISEKTLFPWLIDLLPVRGPTSKYSASARLRSPFLFSKTKPDSPMHWPCVTVIRYRNQQLSQLIRNSKSIGTERAKGTVTKEDQMKARERNAHILRNEALKSTLPAYLNGQTSGKEDSKCQTMNSTSRLNH